MSKPLIDKIPDIKDDGLMGDLMVLLGDYVEEAVRLLKAGDLKKLESAAGTAKRSLMSFDKLNRLTASSGKGKSKTPIENFFKALKDGDVAKNMAGIAGSSARWLREMGFRLRDGEYVLGKVQESMATMPHTITRMTLPVVNFVKEMTGFPSAIDKSREALSKLDLSYIFTAGLTDKLLAGTEKAVVGIQRSFQGMDEFFTTKVSVPLKDLFAHLFAGMPSAAERAWQDTMQVFSQTADYFKTTFQKAWNGVLSVFSSTEPTFSGVVGSVVSSMKTVMNRLISGINQAIVEPFSGINNVFSKLKTFTVNGVQPFKNLNFSVSMPSIPYLAAGAVLPANKPFLAMVGDQKHGTNVEAPLATIQQAVAEVMGDVVEAEMAGHNATASVLRQILEAVLGISLDEHTLGSAMDAYNARRAVMTGGF